MYTATELSKHAKQWLVEKLHDKHQQTNTKNKKLDSTNKRKTLSHLKCKKYLNKHTNKNKNHKPQHLTTLLHRFKTLVQTKNQALGKARRTQNPQRQTNDGPHF